jgi:hypothetical protein
MLGQRDDEVQVPFEICYIPDITPSASGQAVGDTQLPEQTLQRLVRAATFM